MNAQFSAPPFPTWPRRAGSTLALVASLTFAINPTLVLAQALDATSTPQIDLPAKPAPKPAAKKARRHMANDNVSDDLNRREAQRAAEVVREMNAASGGASSTATTVATSAATAVAKPAQPQLVPQPVLPSDTTATSLARGMFSEPPTFAAIPPRAPVVTASLTPIVSTTKDDAPSTIAPVLPAADAAMGKSAKPGSLALPKLPEATAGAPKPASILPSTSRLAQAQPPGAAPVPVPIQQPRPTISATPAQAPATVTSGAPGRQFGQSQMVSPQQPTLALEVNKGTAIRLPGPATTVFVAAPDIADVQVKSPGIIYVFAKKPGDTVLYAVDDQDHVLLNTIVSVSSPVSRIKSTLDTVHPGNDISFSNQGETIVLTGTARSAAIAEDARRLALQHVNNNASKVISNIRIDAPTQVQLRVKVAEVNRGSLKRVGINWQNMANIAQFGVGGITIGGAIQTVQSIGGPSSGAIAATGANGGVTTFIDFLATQNLATVLAEPNLIAMSGETASFLAGGEIPVVAPQGGIGGSTISVTYKQVGVSLSFTPTIINDRINLKVTPEVSQVTTTGQVSVPLTSTATVVIPAIETRRASTTVELGSGQSFAIAGLLQQGNQQDVVKMPWLGDIPILGALFKSDAYQRSETELVIVVTPYLVEPTSGPLRTPLTGRVPPTDVDRLLLSRTSHPTPPAQIQVGREQQNAGPTAGFRLD